MWGAEWNLFENLAKIDEDDDGSIFYESGRHMTMRTSLLSVFKQLTWLAIFILISQVLGLQLRMIIIHCAYHSLVVHRSRLSVRYCCNMGASSRNSGF